jgi:hypothetical protein
MDNGKCLVKFMGPTEDKPNRHIYYVNGERAKSVTGIIGIKDKSGALVPWALEEAAKSLITHLEAGEISAEHIIKAVFASEEAKNKAADLGTAVHDWVEKYIKFKLKEGKMPEMPKDKNIMTGVNSFLEWEAGHKVKYLWAEKLLYSKKYGYIGKGDFAAIVDGERCLCDLKSGNGLYNSVRMQCAAYQKADEEETKEKYDGRWAIRIAKETEQEYYDRMAIKNKIKTFLGKKEKEVSEYQIFEAKFLDIKGDECDKDFKAFINCLELGEWDSENYSV